MTELRYGPTVVPSPAPSPGRIVVIALATLLGPPPALVVAFIAAVTWSGCFLSCSQPNHVGGALLFGLALLMVLAGPLLAWLLLRRWRAVGCAVLGVVGVLLTLGLLAGLG